MLWNLLTALIAASVGACVNLWVWYFFRRSIERLDSELSDLREKRIKTIEDRMTICDRETIDGRRRVYAHVDRTFMPRELCTTHRENLEKKMAQTEQEFVEVKSDVKYIRAHIAEHGALLKLIGDRLNVSLGDK